MGLIEITLAIIGLRSGTISADGQPVSGAKMSFSRAGAEAITATTDDMGRFNVDLPEGVYEVSIERGRGKSASVLTISTFGVGAGNEVVALNWPKGTDEERAASTTRGFADGGADLAAGRYDDAIAKFEAALGTDPMQPGLWASMALAHTGKRDFSNAVYAGQMSVRFGPRNAGYRNNLGGIYFRQGRYEDAAAAYKKAAELNPGGRGLYMSNLAAAYAAMGRDRDAIDAYRAATEDANVPPSSWYYMGALSDRAGDSDGAIAAYRRYLTAQPNGAFADRARERLRALGG
jgi:Tfp pilus assembly protein PilF